MKRKLIGLATLGALTLVMDNAAAQYPPQPQPYPQQPQPYPAQPYPPQAQPYPQPYPQQPYPPQPQPYPAQPQPYPQQPYQPYPPQAQPYPQPYPQPYQPYPQQPVYPQPPPPPPQSQTRTQAEMVALYITSSLYGIGTGIWLDALFGIDDPGAAIIMPLAFGAGAPVGVWATDRYTNIWKRGVPASTAAGMVLGGVEGIAIAGTQWQYTHEDDKDWSFRAQTSVTWILATAGGVGGFAFGEWLKPDPRSMLFIGSGAGWGALSGSMFGISVQGRSDDWKDGSSVAGLIGYNVGLVGAGAISIVHTPSLQSQKYMWLGYLAGAAVGSLVFPFYLFVEDPNLKRGLIGPAVGGVAGAALAGVLTWNMRDASDGQPQAKHWEPPVDLAMAPIPPLTPTATNSTSQSSRSLSNMVGPDPRFSAAPPGAMLSAVATF